jgi:AraC-like DNA-binding protein
VDVYPHTLPHWGNTRIVPASRTFGGDFFHYHGTKYGFEKRGSKPMSRVGVYSTDGIEPSRRMAYWNDRASECIVPLVSDVNDVDSFRGSIRQGAVGDVMLAEVYSEAQIVRHTGAHVARTRVPLFFVQLQVEGECIELQNGRETRLASGDFTLCDSSRKFETVFGGPNRMLLLGVPFRRLRQYVADPERLAAIPMRSATGLSGFFSSFLVDYWTEYQRGMESASDERCIAAVLDLLAAAYADVVPSPDYASSLVEAHTLRILKFVESHVKDCDLTVSKIAQACRITPRYVHQLFENRKETVSSYILRRRLELSQAALSSRESRGRSMTAIAFDHGFNSQTHFCRVFREKYGMTPREYRRSKMALIES